MAVCIYAGDKIRRNSPRDIYWITLIADRPCVAPVRDALLVLER